MAESITEFIKQIDLIRKKINAVKSPQLQSLKVKEELRTTIRIYFDKIRPMLIDPNLDDPEIKTIDENFQELLVLCHQKGSIKSYKQKLEQNRKKIVSQESKLISTKPIQSSQPNHNDIDLQIIKTLESILPSAALSYKQAIIDLQIENRMSWRGPATDLREALRETLDHLAPDKEVEAIVGYKPVKEAAGPTMKQKVRFILMKRGLSKSLTETSENAAELVESGVGLFVRSIYTRSSISTHTSTGKSEVVNIRNYVRVALCELLEIQL
jgi:hypothetical protein